MSNGKVILYCVAFLLCVCLVPSRAQADPPSPFIPQVPMAQKGSQPTPSGFWGGGWTIAPFVSYYTLTGSGPSRYFNSALGIGGELQKPLSGSMSDWRWNVDGSYLQMTPGPTLFVTSSQNSLFGQPSQTPISSPVPGSASITGWILRTGLAREFPRMLPDGWLGHGVVAPYLRIDVGGVDLAASGAGALSGHPLGVSVDGGAGVSLRVPSSPMGVFMEITPTEIFISGEALFMTPLVAGITFHF